MIAIYLQIDKDIVSGTLDSGLKTADCHLREMKTTKSSRFFNCLVYLEVRLAVHVSAFC